MRILVGVMLFGLTTLGFCQDATPSSVEELVRNAEEGLVDAQYNLGVMYADGVGVPQDSTAAAQWLRKAAEQGHAEAQFHLGTMYRNGKGVPQDGVEATKWFRKAAEQGDARAQHNLASMYYAGDDVPKDYAEAMKWYRKAAAQGVAGAQNNLGLMYDHGEGVAENDAEAMRWYRRAAEQGLAVAQGHVGWMYAEGMGVPKDGAEAVKWFRKAAEQGDVKAQAMLGLIYVLGKGVAKDNVAAYTWFIIAAVSGDARAQKSRDVVKRRLTPAQLERGRAMARSISDRIEKRNEAAKPDGPNLVSQINVVTLGEVGIRVPPPDQCQRIDGLSSDYDSYMALWLPPDQILLAQYGYTEDVDAVRKGDFPLGTTGFNVQAVQSLESLTVSKHDFSGIKRIIRDEFEDSLPPEFQEAMRQIEHNVSQALSGQIKQGMSFEVEQTIPLGVFDETSDSISMSALVKAKWTGPMLMTDVSSVTATSACMLNTRGKVVYLYCRSTYEGQKTVDWTQSAVMTWRDQIRESNR